MQGWLAYAIQYIHRFKERNYMIISINKKRLYTIFNIPYDIKSLNKLEVEGK